MCYTGDAGALSQQVSLLDALFQSCHNKSACNKAQYAASMSMCMFNIHQNAQVAILHSISRRCCMDCHSSSACQTALLQGVLQQSLPAQHTLCRLLQSIHGCMCHMCDICLYILLSLKCNDEVCVCCDISTATEFAVRASKLCSRACLPQKQCLQARCTSVLRNAVH